MNIGDRIKQEIDADPAKSQVSAAAYAGIGKTTMSDLIAGRSRSSTKLHLIAEYLGVTTRWLETGKPPKHPSGQPETHPVSYGDATEVDASPIRLRRVQIRGSATVGVDGFWRDVEASAKDETYPVLTTDPNAFAIRIVGRRYHPAISSGQCVLVEPGSELKLGRRALVVLQDGRSAVRDFHSHENGVWMFTNMLDPSDFLELADHEVLSVQRITSTFDTD